MTLALALLTLFRRLIVATLLPEFVVELRDVDFVRLCEKRWTVEGGTVLPTLLRRLIVVALLLELAVELRDVDFMRLCDNPLLPDIFDLLVPEN